jgi:hypothetical protein
MCCFSNICKSRNEFEQFWVFFDWPFEFRAVSCDVTHGWFPYQALAGKQTKKKKKRAYAKWLFFPAKANAVMPKKPTPGPRVTTRSSSSSEWDRLILFMWFLCLILFDCISDAVANDEPEPAFPDAGHTSDTLLTSDSSVAGNAPVTEASPDREQTHNYAANHTVGDKLTSHEERMKVLEALDLNQSMQQEIMKQISWIEDNITFNLQYMVRIIHHAIIARDNCIRVRLSCIIFLSMKCALCGGRSSESSGPNWTLIIRYANYHISSMTKLER